MRVTSAHAAFARHDTTHMPQLLGKHPFHTHLWLLKDRSFPLDSVSLSQAALWQEEGVCEGEEGEEAGWLAPFLPRGTETQSPRLWAGQEEHTLAFLRYAFPLCLGFYTRREECCSVGPWTDLNPPFPLSIP